MRNVFLHTMVSLDGFIEGPDQELDWHFADDEFEEYINNMLRSIDGMLFGRVADQLLADYWPTAAENPMAAADPSNPQRHIEAAHMMNKLPKFVLSTTLKETEWNNSHIISGNIAEEVLKLKQQPGKDIALFAGADLAATFMKLGLIDEYRLVVNPVLLGGGTRLFKGGYERSNLKLLDVKTFASGALVLTYRPDKKW
jgi:dihydrofolate reductase